MDILYLLIPLSLVLVLLIGVVLWWAIGSGQFDDIEREGENIFDESDDFDARGQDDENNSR